MDMNMLNRKIRNREGMLEGCKNRMCITKDEDELFRLRKSAIEYADELFVLNLKRIRNCEKLTEDLKEDEHEI